MSHDLLNFTYFMLPLAAQKPSSKLHLLGAVLLVMSFELSFSEWIMYGKHL